ncbi:hypothetical protein CPJCM30710_02150 [Clostridium polyendosporum]|uniref:Uncharacterized protein n=1 Tax=Clostridium polyendosporum TaxID=69208 RepID=A0A919RWD7_9CLOT|nr:hypothetical protein [Clostridium polyendosporum]GIM27549.1 hypothetical protein CPJCM30710_02150 [Clostridium polyendosporum]
MGKPSIFSKEYEKRMKKRKKRILVILLIILCMSGVITTLNFKFFSLTNIRQKVETTLNNKNKDNVLSDTAIQDNGTNQVQENKNISQESKEVSQENTAGENENKDEDNEEKYIEVTLSSGNIARAIYDEESGKRKFKALIPIEEGTTFDISPNKDFLIINDGGTQQIKFVDTRGTQKNITYPSYTTKNKEVIVRETMLNDYPGYTWSKNAKFIDDTHVVYLSQLPYFGKNQLLTYMWSIDINTGVHTTLWNVKGSNIKIGNLTDNGLEVEIDGNKKILTPNATLIQ